MSWSKHRIILVIFILLIPIEYWLVGSASDLVMLVVFTAFLYLIVLVFGSYFMGLNYYLNSRNKLNYSAESAKKIALTFDDGPNDYSTLFLLNILDKHNVKVSFFCIGKQIEAFPEQAKEIVKRGHLLANHSYSHSYTFALSSYGKVRDEIENTNQLIWQISQQKNMYFRPPFGVTNPIIASVVKKLNILSIGWSLRSYDTVISGAKLLNKLKMRVQHNDIILMHDRSENLDVIDDFITYAKAQGFQFVLISDNENEK